MKKVFIVCLSGIISLAACTNNDSPTVGDWERDKTEETHKSEATTKDEHEAAKPEKAESSSATGASDSSQRKTNVDKGASEYRKSEDKETPVNH